MSDVVQIRVDSPSATITLNRPQLHNCLTVSMVNDLIQAFDDLLLEKRVRAVILIGAGSSFCSGTDLRELQASYEQEDHFVRWYEEVSQLRTLIETMLRFPKPIITAASGAVAGTGAALMLASDIVVAGEDLRFSLPEPTRGLSSSLTIPLIHFRGGLSSLTQALLAGMVLDASTARQAGWAHEVVDSDLIWAKSQQLAEFCAAGARESHQMIKRMINETLGEALLRQLSIGAADMASARTTDAAREGIAAFLEKRSPLWN